MSSQLVFIGASSMQIDQRTVGEVVVLDPKGRGTTGEGDEPLKERLLLFETFDSENDAVWRFPASAKV